MTKRVQLVRDDNAGSLLFLGKDGEITVNTGNKSIHVHDAVNQGGTELARADVNNVVVATSGNAGKMSAQQASELAQALLDIVTNAAGVATNLANINTNDTDITNLQNSRANKIIPAAVNNVATLDAAGDLQDSGDLLSDYFKLAGGGGNVMLFYQAAAPTGWTKLVTQNNKALRVVSGSGGVAGGTDSFSAVFAKTATDAYTLLAADIPAHDHGAVGNHAHSTPYSATGGGAEYTISKSGLIAGFGGSTSSAGGHTHTSFGGGGAHSHGLANFDIQYVDLILCSKD